jgi:tetratricopeptide (TPR) repeat protein
MLTLVAVLALLSPQSDPAARTAYERGRALVESGNPSQARGELERALAAAPQEAPDYLPHLYLAIACHMTGDTAAAKRHLSAAESSGAAEGSETGRQLLGAFRLLLGQKPERASFRRYDRKAPRLAETEVGRIRREVLSRCRLPADAKASDAPWYFHYELGLSLAEHGDPQRALDALIDSVDRRPEPQRKARLYGMWFLDYLPYLQIARAHAKLGNRECALDALRLSQDLGETSPEDRDALEVKALLADLKE